MRQDTTGDRINTLWEDKQTLKAERGNIEKKNVLKIDKINKKNSAKLLALQSWSKVYIHWQTR